MSYSIFIGELKEEPASESSVVEVEHEDAPVLGFNDESGKTNGRFPGYSQMTVFCRETGLHELFFKTKIGLLSEHPGCKAITKEHLSIIIKAREQWEVEHPDCKNLIPTKDKEDPNRESWEQEDRAILFDWNYGRLLWYEFWFRWSLENCKNPVIVNS